MNNRNNNYDRGYNENEQNYQQSLPRQQQSRVVEIPVIHCPTTTQNTQPLNYPQNTSNFQHIPSRPFQSFQQPPSLFDTFDSPFGMIFFFLSE
jgi:hypothetical protein